MAARAVAEVKPLLSSTSIEARRRVFNLYREWYREVPRAIQTYKLDITVDEGRNKVREMFLRNAGIHDLRKIDMLIIKGRMELQEINSIWKAKTHIMRYFEETKPERPKEFLSKFLDGHYN
ncbi:NADH dehydrogenase [ubiquinone] 1 alpha subcomplex subunit 6 [Trichoplax sp. H2]|uniref:NADH dehydrogenase [ubiquinone] 1 alpha subcomplex subunit 6 n=1 Tax=Trichoplax adhaerens TaxID=10228 RepID=B3S830_TRIAD|nr:hypothetical protein TRIADDRAFT_60386 [Trichoplax adhaerens]EDV21122.1 hypothetical protein TRIADDRAFT_60386 [Trichoplax adhaerens]RDD39608.1 NADH dehydrogenase [ubiquinone] 1 alpha subcomplex subunit 6 [Trichoplax sp. H2]|eukprot:XP_002116452.1 hypothetical protein TRIADDRAFT_60386 [Trichoplax adhaerens]